jgi:UDP-glucose 4-epimerase
MKLTDKQVIVTGAYGFLGRHVAKVFSENGYTVTGLGHGTWLRSEWQHWGLSEWHPCNISMESLNTYVQQPEVVVHCAGSGSVGYSLTHPMQDFERTVSTTLTLLEFLRLHSPETVFVYPSSAAVYGNVDTLPIAESTPLNPISPYGVHKKITEELIVSYSQHFSLPVAIARFFSLYGPGLRKQLLWDACTKLEKGDFDFYGTGYEVRDWLHVQDAARLLLTLSSHASSDAVIVNGGTGAGTPVKDIIAHLIEKMNRQESPRFSRIPKPGDPPGYIADIGKVKEYGWKPEISIEDGLDEYVHWYRSGAP